MEMQKAAEWPVERLLNLKADQKVSVVLPALNEERTIGPIVKTIREELMSTGVVDELVVMDSGCTDRTAEIATGEGARVVQRDDVVPEYEPLPGKGEVMWRSLAATTGDVICFSDSDLDMFDSGVIRGPLGALIGTQGAVLAKGVYDNPLRVGNERIVAGGGRVTELMVRPLLNAVWPELRHLVQPLSGEMAVYRDVLEALTMPTGYGVETAMILDIAELYGAAGIVQVDIGTRNHQHQSNIGLGRMAFEVLQVALDRLGMVPEGSSMLQFVRENGELQGMEHAMTAVERPAMKHVPSYWGS